MPPISKNMMYFGIVNGLFWSLTILAMTVQHHDFTKTAIESRQQKKIQIDSLSKEMAEFKAVTDRLYNKIVLTQSVKADLGNSASVQTLVNGLKSYYFKTPTSTAVQSNPFPSIFRGTWCLIRNASVGDTLVCLQEYPKYSFFLNGRVLKSLNSKDINGKIIHNVSDYSWTYNGQSFYIGNESNDSNHKFSEIDLLGSAVTFASNDMFYIGSPHDQTYDAFLRISY